MMNRRSFVKKSGVLAATSTLLSPAALLDKRLNQYGAMLYTVRDLMKTDPANTLLRIREMGYYEVEHAGYDEGKFYGLEPKDFQTLCYQRGLRVRSGHVQTGFTSPGKSRTMVRDWEAALDDMAEIDQEYVVLGYLQEIERKTIDDYKRIADLLNECGEIARKKGIRMAYHNHAFEFQPINGQVPMDVLLDLTDDKMVAFEIDLYWVHKAQVDPVSYFEKYPKRFELWHVKDMDNTEEQFFTEVGTGVIDWERMFSNAKQAGMKHFYVEQDVSRQHNPLRSLKISREYLGTLRF